MKKLALASSALVLASLVASPSTARAETHDEARVGSGWVYVFRDELVGAPGLDASAPRVVVRPRVGAAPLVRPRTQFVSELLASVESL